MSCSICLGGDTDIPPFGSIHDARDLIQPCKCSFVAHKKCLLDWVNSLPPDKLHVFDPSVLGADRASQNLRNVDPVLEFQQPDNININIELSPAAMSNWFTFGAFSFGPRHVMVLAPCPHCKADVIFSMRRARAVTVAGALRAAAVRSAQNAAVFVGLTSAVSGVMFAGYVGLTAAGVKIMDWVVPEPLLVLLLSRQDAPLVSMLSRLFMGRSAERSPLPFSAFRTSAPASASASSPAPDFERALRNGLIDPLKFSRIRLLPILIYSMRTLNIWLVQDLPAEITINWFISSLGNHQLARRLYENVAANPWKVGEWVRGIDWWHENVLVAALAPLRIAYDVFFRASFNQVHFDIVKQVRPRDIANQMGEGFAEFEDYSDKLTSLETVCRDRISKGHWQAFWKDNLLLRIAKLRLIIWCKKLKACVSHDYSQTLLYRSFTARCLTSILWPFASSTISEVVYRVFFRGIAGVPKENLRLAANVASLVVVVLAKDAMNLYLAHQKGQQLRDMDVIKLE